MFAWFHLGREDSRNRVPRLLPSGNSCPARRHKLLLSLECSQSARVPLYWWHLTPETQNNGITRLFSAATSGKLQKRRISQGTNTNRIDIKLSGD